MTAFGKDPRAWLAPTSLDFLVIAEGGRISFLLGVLSGALFSAAETLLFPSLVIAVFVDQLTDDMRLVGLVPALAAVWFIPRWFSRALVQDQSRQLPWVTAASFVRAASIGLFAFALSRSGDINNSDLLRSFLICYVAYNLASGFASAPTTEMLRKSVLGPARALLFRQRALWGGLAGLIAALATYNALDATDLTFPENFRVLFVAAASVLFVAAVFQLLIQEPARMSVGPPRASAALRSVPTALGDGNFRRFLSYRVLLGLSIGVDPFLILYAQRELDAPLSAVGLYLGVFTLARLVASPLWAMIGAHRGDRAVLQVTGLLRLLMPLAALTIPSLVETRIYQDRVSDERIGYYLFAIVFTAHGAAFSGQLKSGFGYLMDIARADRRSAYFGLINGVLAVVSFSAMLAGAIVNRYGFEELLVAAAGVGFLTIFASGLLTDTHAATRRPATAWRLREARS